jgi:MoaE-MoaD fusion protein
VAKVRLFAHIREVAGTATGEFDGATVTEVLSAASARWGADFASALPLCAVWVNGTPAGPDTAVSESDEVAVLPPVSGGNGEGPS